MSELTDKILSLDLSKEEDRQKFQELLKEMEKSAYEAGKQSVRPIVENLAKRIQKLKVDKESVLQKLRNISRQSSRTLELEKQLMTLQAKLKEKDELLKRMEREKELQQLKLKKLQEYQLDLDPAMVPGSSEEEVDNFLKQFKAKIDAVKKQTEEELLKKAKEIGLSVKVESPTGQGEMKTELTAEDIAKMSLEEYMKHRDKILRQFK
jgi:phage gp37-like protein